MGPNSLPPRRFHPPDACGTLLKTSPHTASGSRHSTGVIFLTASAVGRAGKCSRVEAFAAAYGAVIKATRPHLPPIESQSSRSPLHPHSEQPRNCSRFFSLSFARMLSHFRIWLLLCGLANAAVISTKRDAFPPPAPVMARSPRIPTAELSARYELSGLQQNDKLAW